MKDGYSIIKQGIPESMLTKVWMDLHFLVVKQLQRFEIAPTANMKTNLELLLHADKNVYIATLNFASRLKSVVDLFTDFFNAGVCGVYQPVLHVMANTLKVPGGYWGTAPHQDWSSMQGSLDSTTIWIPITNTEDNFPLEIIEGSHTKGLLDGKVNGSVLEVECDGEFIPVDAEFGDVVMISSFLVHRTGQGGNGLRIAASMRFENANEPTFIERGYPCAQKRVVDRELKWKPTKEQINAVG